MLLVNAGMFRVACPFFCSSVEHTLDSHFILLKGYSHERLDTFTESTFDTSETLIFKQALELFAELDQVLREGRST